MCSSFLKSKWQDLDLNHLFASSLTVLSTPCLSSLLVKVTRAMRTGGQGTDPGSLSPHNFVMVNTVWILGVTGLNGQDYFFLPFSGRAGNVKLGTGLTPVKFKESKVLETQTGMRFSSEMPTTLAVLFMTTPAVYPLQWQQGTRGTYGSLLKMWPQTGQ